MGCMLSAPELPSQGYGAVSPAAGLALLHAVLASNSSMMTLKPFGVVSVNPFDWALFLRGELPCLIHIPKGAM